MTPALGADEPLGAGPGVPEGTGNGDAGAVACGEAVADAVGAGTGDGSAPNAGVIPSAALSAATRNWVKRRATVT